MTVSHVSDEIVGPMSADDTRLTLVTSRAAIEFDRAARGLQVDFWAANILGDFLRSSFDVPHENIGATQRNVDGGTLFVVGKSLSSAPQTIRDVVEGALAIVGSIDKTAEQSTTDAAMALRDFCIALTNNIIAFRDSYSEPRPTSRFRR